MVEFLEGVGRPFLAEGIPPVLTGGAMRALVPSLRGERLGMAVGEDFLAWLPGALISSRVDCRSGEGTGERAREGFCEFVGEGIPMPALIGERWEAIVRG